MEAQLLMYESTLDAFLAKLILTQHAVLPDAKSGAKTKQLLCDCIYVFTTERSIMFLYINICLFDLFSFDIPSEFDF